jgi:hypothetical protein
MMFPSNTWLEDERGGGDMAVSMEGNGNMLFDILVL